MKKTRKNKESNTSTMADIVSKLFFALMLAILPLFFNSKRYTGMIGAKGDCYIGIAIIMGIGIVATIIYSLYKKEKIIRDSDKSRNAMDIAFIMYGVAILLSFIFSEDKKTALWGSGGFRVGTLALVTLVCFYFFVSRKLRGSRNIWGWIIALNIVIFLWIISDTVSLDIFGFHAHIGGQNFHYYACLGQMDSISAYLCLLLPVMIVFFLNEKGFSFGLSTFLVTGLMALTGIRTDGVYIGIAVCALFLVSYALKDTKRLKQLLRLGILWGAAITFYSICSVVIPERIGTDMGVSGTLIKYWAGVFIIVICAGFLYWLEKTRMLVPEKVLRIISGIVVIGLLVVLAVFGLHGVMALSRNDIAWGNGRGGIWLGALDMFQEYGLLQKLFGLGTTVIATDLTYYVTQLNGWQNLIIANTHNEFLEHLLSTGLVGLGSYMAMWIIPIVQYIKQRKQGKEWSDAKVAYFMSLMAYLGQSIVGNPYSLSVPIMFLIFMLYRNEDFVDIANAK